MDSLPPEIFHEILRYVIETQPTDHAVNTRLVNHFWELSITALLIRSTRLETEIGIDRSRARDGRNSRWYPLPARMKMLYMWHKINQHSRAPTVFSVWVETMLELRGIDDSDPDFQEDVIQQLIGGAAVANLVPAEVFRAAQGLPVEEDTRVPDLLRFPWEPLEKTYWVLIAANAMSMGDAEALDYFLTHGYDITGLSMRFRVWIMKSRGRVVSEAMVRVLVQHRAPFTFEGLQFTLDRQYLYRAIESGDQAQLNLLLDHLKRCFRRPMGLLVNAGITHARSIGNNNLATALEARQMDDALEEFPNMSSVPWIDARAQAIALDLLFDT